MNFKNLNLTTPQKLMEFIKNNLNYGFTYRGKVYTDDKPDFNENMNKFYKLKKGVNFVKSGYGVCWDFCEFERDFFNQLKIKHECYFIVNFLTRSKGGPTHTFLIYEQKGKWYWFEYAWFNYRGIWEYNSKEEALKDIVSKFINLNATNYNHTELYITQKAKAGLDTYNFCEHCFNGQKVGIIN